MKIGAALATDLCIPTAALNVPAPMYCTVCPDWASTPKRRRGHMLVSARRTGTASELDWVRAGRVNRRVEI